MRVATIAGRATVLTGAGALDVEKASQGRFPADPGELFERWEEFRAWADEVDPSRPGTSSSPAPPAGVGMARTPPRYLRPGDEVVSQIEGIGAIRQDVVAAS
jgi:hypothetical protein